MTLVELPAQAANIVRAVESGATCSSSVVESLKLLLLPTAHTIREEAPGIVSGQPKPKKPTAVRTKVANSRAKKQPAVVVHECVENEHQDTLKSQEKLLLATEVVNVTLRALTTAIKTARLPQTPKSIRRSLARSSSSAPKPGSCNTPRCQTPLQPVSANRIIQSPADGKNFRCSSSASFRDSNGTRAQAECARMGLACLRSFQAMDSFSTKFAPLQLETGMSALIAKFLALGYDDLALKELRIVRKRIEAIASGQSGTGVRGSCNVSKKTGGMEVDHQKDSLYDLLRYTAAGLSGSLLRLVVTSQIQVLKIIASKGHSPNTEAVLEHLRTDVNYAPSNLIDRQIDPKDPKTRINAIHQLEILAQAVMRLCPNVSKATEESSKMQPSLSAEATLSLQSLAFQIRLRWWALSEHQPNVEAEVLGPFSRYLGAFQRRCKLERSKKYSLAKNTFSIITTALTAWGKPYHYKSIAIFKILTDLASEDSRDGEAIQWIEMGLTSLDAVAGSSSQRSAFLCRLATCHLRERRNYPDDSRLLRSLRDAKVCLERNLQGESTELDELLVAVADLRKTAFLFAQDNSMAFDPSQVLLETSCLGLCTQIILLSLRFLARYVGKEPPKEATESKVSRYAQRRRFASQSLSSMTASVIAVSKLSVKSDMEVWCKFDTGLQDCLELTAGLGAGFSSTQGFQQTTDNSLSTHVSVSQTYWLRFHALKSMGAEATVLASCLKTSINILENQTSGEKAKGLLLTKLGNYGFLCEAMQDYKAAAKSYEQAIRFSIDDGGIRRLAEATLPKPYQSAVTKSREFEQIGQALLAFPKATSKIKARASGSRIFFDAEWLPCEERGLILHQQFSSVISILLDRGTSSFDREDVHALSTILLSAYDKDKFYIQRLHVCVQLLHLSTVHPMMYEHSMVCKILEELDQQLPLITGYPNGSLQRYAAHLTSCAHVYMNISSATDSPDSRYLETVLADWCRLLRESPNRQALEEHVYDIPGWLQQLDFMSAYLKLNGNETLQTAVLYLLVSVHEGTSSTRCLALASNLMSLGIHYARLGYSGVGDITLQKAQRFLDVSDVPTQLAAEWYLTNAEHNLLNGSLDKCSYFLKQAREASLTNLRSMRQHGKDRTVSTQSIAEVLLIHSKFAAERGDQGETLFFARVSVQEYQRTWANLESRLISRKKRSPVGHAEENLVEAVSKLSISESQTTCHSKYAALRSSVFWHLTPRIFAGLLHLSQCCAHTGLLSEAQFYLDQCQKIADVVRSPSMIWTCLSLQGQYAICNGAKEQGLVMLREVQKAMSDLPSDFNNISLNSRMAILYMKAGQFEVGNATCIESMRRLQSLMMKSAPDLLLYKPAETQNMELQMRSLKLESSPQAPTKKTRGTRKKAPTKPSVQPRGAISSEAEEFLPPDVMPLSNLKGDLLRHSTFASLSQGDLDTAKALLEDASALQQRRQDVIMQGMLHSQINLRQGLQHLVGDPVFSILPESTFCCPAVAIPKEPETRPISPLRDLKHTKFAPSKTLSKKAMPSNKINSDGHSQHLLLARKCLSEVFSMAKTAASTSTVHTVAKTLSRILIMLSALPNTLSKGLCSSHFLAYTLEIGREVAMQRESLSISVEYQLSEKRDPDRWPEFKGHDEGIQEIHSGENEYFDFSKFQEDYIDIVPKSWTILSMTLSESHEEIWVSKIRAEESPFILRLPFNRENTLEGDEESFTFKEGSSEMLDIVKLANTSAHSAGDLSRKGAKTEWWETRAHLDTRLKDLLTNIDNIWFGGFRGIFSTDIPDPGLLARFQQSLYNILDKHLPSRKTSAKAKRINRIRLDPRVLELFVGLGPPSANNDLDEKLMDLLYFVVDILQFHKERNAYDEIDFDAIVIETADALRQYHQAANAGEASLDKQHMILILDKNLHHFPWESLPCMSGQSVSRLPSLGCLRRRILQMRKDKEGMGVSEPLEGVYANPNRGAYILNPGGDLATTQATFEESLRGLSNWDSFIEQEPSEADMKSCLQDHKLFLYFGHGSGGQYIRSRTIKKLEQCAVSLLMGCSSGALTQAGEFEAYGTPMSYMHAGCPALLATLWDVTDKDIDRYSDGLLRTWGLFKDGASGSTSSPVKKSAKSKGKIKAQEKELVTESCDVKVSLDEAVAKSRGHCILKYLNGAAPVVYGVPVYLS